MPLTEQQVAYSLILSLQNQLIELQQALEQTRGELDAAQKAADSEPETNG